MILLRAPDALVRRGGERRSRARAALRVGLNKTSAERRRTARAPWTSTNDPPTINHRLLTLTRRARALAPPRGAAALQFDFQLCLRLGFTSRLARSHRADVSPSRARVRRRERAMRVVVVVVVVVDRVFRLDRPPARVGVASPGRRAARVPETCPALRRSRRLRVAADRARRGQKDETHARELDRGDVRRARR